MKKTYFVISIEQNGKRFAFADTLANGENIMAYINKQKGIETLTACDTRTEAERTAAHWNECYRKRGSYMFA